MKVLFKLFMFIVVCASTAFLFFSGEYDRLMGLASLMFIVIVMMLVIFGEVTIEKKG